MALSVFVKMLDPIEIEKLSKAFLSFDKEANGMINLDDFKEVLKRVGPQICDEDITNMFEQIDLDNNGKIKYSEFLIASINV